jgi:IS30 family transposase
MDKDARYRGKQNGFSQRSIADFIDIGQSTVRRELALNSGQHGYRLEQA